MFAPLDLSLFHLNRRVLVAAVVVVLALLAAAPRAQADDLLPVPDQPAATAPADGGFTPTDPGDSTTNPYGKG